MRTQPPHAFKYGMEFEEGGREIGGRFLEPDTRFRHIKVSN
jgi:hypothetical protein